MDRASDAVQPMPPRVRGERSTDTPRTQAAPAINRGLSPRGVGRSPGPADGRAGIGSERGYAECPFASASPRLRF